MIYEVTLENNTINTVECRLVHEWLNSLGEQVDFTFAGRLNQIIRFYSDWRPYLPKPINWTMEEDEE